VHALTRFACIAVVATCVACPGPRSGAASRVEAQWRVETVTQTASGGDVDDAGHDVLFVGVKGDAFVVRLGGAAGVCETDPHDDMSAVCGAAPNGLVTRLVCGRDPHVDQVYCFDAKRTDEGIVLSRRVFDVPSVDGPAPPPKLIESRELAKVDLAKSCEVVIVPTVTKDVVEGEGL
jgi:hypothetical protein